MKASEARAQWKEVLDRATQGEVIQIERGGVIYWLKAMVNVMPTPPTGTFYDEAGFVDPKDLEKINIPGHTVHISSTPTGKKKTSVGFANAPSKIELDNKLKSFAEEKKMTFCPNGHAIPAGRSKCMGKGCKYAK